MHYFSDILCQVCLTAGAYAIVALAQASLKNYLRAVLAIQHGCVRGSIPVWGPAGRGKSRKSANSAEPRLREGLVESEATGRAALST